MPRSWKQTGRSIGMAVALATFGLPGPAAAQGKPDSRVSVGAGIGFATPFHGDFDFTPVSWDVSVRVGKGTARFEAAWAEWRHERSVDIPAPALPGIGGGSAGLLRQVSTRTSRVGQLNLVAEVRTGVVTWFAGGGAGVMVLRNEFRQTPIGCTGSNACVDFDHSDSNAGLTAQGVFGADVGVTDALAIFGQGRLIILTRDVGTSDLRYTAGARWRF